MATVRDVAREAGVSPATVSRALNNSFLVTAETYERVVTAMKKLGYEPNNSSANAKRGGFIICLFGANNYDFQRAAQRTARELGHGFLSLPVGTGGDAGLGAYETLTGIMDSINVSGFIINAMTDEMDSKLRRILLQYPVVQVDSCVDLPNNYIVRSDISQATYSLIRDAISRGCKNIALLGNRNMYRISDAARQLISGYHLALAENGLMPWLYEAEMSQESIAASVEKMVDDIGRAPDVIITVIHDAGNTCINTLRKLGFNIPDDTEIIVLGGRRSLEASSTKALPIGDAESLGQEAVHLLSNAVNGKITGSKTINIPLDLN